jgi:lactoylglutathione lyase
MNFGYAIVYVDSVADTLKFYQEAFGFETRFLHESGQYGELETGNTALAFASHVLGEMNLGGHYQKSNLSTAPLGIELAFVSEDVPKAYAKAVSAGAISINPPSKKPWGQEVAYVRAKEGSLIEICSPIGG